jgi:hypothetical protein
MAMQISGVTIQGGMNILPAGGAPSPTPGGVSDGYTSGGADISDTKYSTIQSFPFSSDGNASDVGNLSAIINGQASQSSTTSGYSSGGYGTGFSDVIDKFPFASSTSGTDVGNITSARSVAAGNSSADNGYISGGALGGIIEKFPFASDGNSASVGNLSQDRGYAAGQNSSSHGYNSGGHDRSPANTGPVNTIDKFPFASDGNATDVGDLTINRQSPAGQSSSDNGYASGGWPVDTIDKFPFSSDSNSSDIGDLTLLRTRAAGQSSAASGYTSGGFATPTLLSNVIDKFPFSSDGNATDVGDLTASLQFLGGHQG